MLLFPGLDLLQPLLILGLQTLLRRPEVFPAQQGIRQTLHAGELVLVVVGILVPLAVPEI